MTDITELAQSLKAAAEEATPGGWCIDDYHGVIADAGLNGNYYIASCSGPDHRSNKRFIALANPANVLALVEALEKAQQRNGELETYSKTALEFREAARDENRHLKLELEIAEKRIAELEDAEQKLCSANVTLDARAEQAERERENWRTSFDNERFRADKLKAHIDDMEPIRAAAEKLVRCKGRYHSELNYRALAALFGVKTPDLPPLEHENVHYADAAEMEIAALRQRIAEMESRTVTAAAADVLAERQRQVTAEGWTAEGDDSYQNSELADAAACYAIHAHNQGFSTPAHWPWSTTWWKQTNPRRDLVKAGALILAEIERIDRAAGIKVAEDSVEPDVSDGNQPGLVVAVHIDVGDFVKFRGQVYEVKETNFDDHDVTLWFVCGEVLKCAAGCQIEVVSAPEEAE